MRILGREVLEALLPPADVIAAVERAFREAAAGRGYVLETGRLPLEGGARELADNPEVRRAYLGEA